MPIDPRTVLAVLFTLLLAQAGLGRKLPFDTTTITSFAVGIGLFAAYLYLARTLVRLPFAVVITVRGARTARHKHRLDWRDSLRDGYTRGFLDTRRWTVAPLVTIDRLAVIGLTLLATTPYLGMFLVRIGGLVGVVLLLVLYLFRGTFSYLVSSPQDNARVNLSSPFLKIHD